MRDARTASVGRAFRNSALAPARAAFARGDSVAGLRAFLDGVIGRPGAFDEMPEETRAVYLRFANEMRAEMLTEAGVYMTRVTCEQTQGVPLPVLLLQGERSARMFDLINARLQSCLLNPDMAIVPGVGHKVQANAQVFNAQVLDFLSRH